MGSQALPAAARSAELERIARAFGEAVGAKDYDTLRALIADELDLRTSTTFAADRPAGPDDVVAAIEKWFGPYAIEAVERIDVDSFAGRARVGYRLRVRKPEGLCLVEQQAYIGAADGTITWLRLMCSGYRPIDD